jgi:PAS domain S-box-containing protein
MREVSGSEAELRSRVDAMRVRNSEERIHRLVDANVIGIVFWEASGRITEANESFLQLVGYTREELLSGGVSWRDMTPSEYRFLDDRARDEVVATGRTTPYEKEFLAKSGQRVPVLVGGASFSAPGQPPNEGVAFILDLREQVRLRVARDDLLVQEQKARIETEVANSRLLLLVEGSKRLAATLKVADTLTALAEIAVPALADWSYVVYRGSNGASAVASAHGDPNKRELLRRLHDCSPELDAPEGAPRVFRTGEIALYEDVTPEQLAPVAPKWALVGTRDPQHLRLIRELGMRSLLCVPIRGRRAVDAVVMLVAASDPRRYGREDVILAEDLAGRAAVALENGRLLAEALEAIQVRDTFLSVAAHELRTPLTSLLLHVEMQKRAIEAGTLDAGRALRAVTATHAQARRLDGLIDTLLDVARLSAGPLVLEVESVDIAQIVRDTVATMAIDADRAGCSLEVAVPPRQVTGRWDPARIEQVVRNLLSNAIKFGPQRPIEVALEATADQVRLSVRDHGIGVAQNERSRIFRRFERAVSARHFGGLGLGLYISGQILRAHHGSLRVESEPGAGACFIAELPRAHERVDGPPGGTP